MSDGEIATGSVPLGKRVTVTSSTASGAGGSSSSSASALQTRSSVRGSIRPFEKDWEFEHKIKYELLKSRCTLLVKVLSYAEEYTKMFS